MTTDNFSNFQDSFLSTEYSLVTDQDTDEDNANDDDHSEGSICVTQDRDTLSEEGARRSGDGLSLAQLWSHCLNPVISNDQECLVIIYTLLREVSNVLLNEENLKCCLCLNMSNIFLTEKGKMLLRLPSVFCHECSQEKSGMKYYDVKYINAVGRIVGAVVRDDSVRISLSSHVLLMLQRMSVTADMAIHEVLHFCRAQQAFHGIRPRHLLARLYDYWRKWWERHRDYLLRLRYDFIRDIAHSQRAGLLAGLRHLPRPGQPMAVRQMFAANPDWLAGLQYVTRLASTQHRPEASTRQPVAMGSAFRPYKPAVVQPVRPRWPHSNGDNSRHGRGDFSSQHHFLPLILPSECGPVYLSHDNIFSPFDDRLDNATATLINRPRCGFVPVASHKSSSLDRPGRQSTNARRRSHVGDTVVLVQSAIQQSMSSTNGNADRLALAIGNSLIQPSFATTAMPPPSRVPTSMLARLRADFALSLASVSQTVFDEAIRQRFREVDWTPEVLLSLHMTVNQLESPAVLIGQKGAQLAAAVEPLIDEPMRLDGDIGPDENGCVDVFSFPVHSASNQSSLLQTDHVDQSNRSSASQSQHNIVNGPRSSSAKENVRPPLPKKNLNIAVLPQKLPIPSKIQLKSNVVPAAAIVLESSDIDSPRNVSTCPAAPTISHISPPQRIQHPQQESQTASARSQKSATKKPPQPPTPALAQEDISFYETIFPASLASLSHTLGGRDCGYRLTSSAMSSKTVKETLENFFQLNQAIHFKFRQLMKTREMISKCSDKNDKKVKKQCLTDLEDQQSNLESLLMNEMKMELTIVEHHSVNVRPILEEIGSTSTSQKQNDNQISLLLTNGGSTRAGITNLLLISKETLVACLFAKGAVSSGLLYEVLLVYREFLAPLELATQLARVFAAIETRHGTRDSKSSLNRARCRLTFILLAWIEGFYFLDFRERLISVVWNLISTKLSRYLKNVDLLFDTIFHNARHCRSNPLVFQFSALKKHVSLTSQQVRAVDVEQWLLARVERDRSSSRHKLAQLLSTIQPGREKSNTIGYQDSFSLLEVSAADLALCLALLQQEIFSQIHPIHFSSYLSCLVGKEEGILERIKAHRFSRSRTIKEGHREILVSLQFSGKLTLWALAEIRSVRDGKLQNKMAKKLVWCSGFLAQLGDLASLASITEALDTVLDTEVDAPKAARLHRLGSAERTSLLLDGGGGAGAARSYSTPLVTVAHSPTLPCTQAVLLRLKMAQVGTHTSPGGLLKWNKLKKVGELLDEVRQQAQSPFYTTNEGLVRLKTKLAARIDHLASLSSSSVPGPFMAALSQQHS